MRFHTFDQAIRVARGLLLNASKEVDTGHWQGVKTGGKPDLVTREYLNYSFDCPVVHNLQELRRDIKPNLPWADDHFLERVSREPSNPGDEYMNWPWWHGQDLKSKDLDLLDVGSTPLTMKFTHTYQERFWPKMAGGIESHGAYHKVQSNDGIRYKYGDLDDVVSLLIREPFTRQATFPIFFPEDTGAAHGGRIPCSLHYHFMLREGKLHLWYSIRSCDFVRHFRDDIYLACRLMLWVLDTVRAWVIAGLTDDDDEDDHPWLTAVTGNLYMTCYSLHYHKGDEHLV